MHNHILTIFLALFAMSLHISSAFAGFPPRLLPQGTVELLDSGAILDKEITAPPGMLMKCRGGCVIEAQGLQLLGSDQTIFGIHEKRTSMQVVIQRGSIDFTLHADAKPLEIITPFKTLHIDPATMATPPQANLRGNINVGQEEVLLTMNDGSVDLQTADRKEVVEPGKPVIVAQRVETPSTAPGATTVGQKIKSLKTSDYVAIGAFTVAGAGLATLGVAYSNKSRDSSSKSAGEISPY